VLPRWTRIASLKSAAAFKAHLEAHHASLPFDDTLIAGAASPLAQPIAADGLRAGNRFCVLPMEGWDCTIDGTPSDLTRRRWRHFGESGAKIIWGGEAVAVRPDGRANPHQLLLAEHTMSAVGALREELIAAHRDRFGTADDLVIGLQLTHSGRYAKPTTAGPAPRIAYRHPILDARVGVSDDAALFGDDELLRLVDDFAAAAARAEALGFDFVDIKHCHGYLGHELLSARGRRGAFGGTLEHRTRFLSDIVSAVRARSPRLRIGVRLSVFDMPPYAPGAGGIGEPEADTAYQSAFGLSRPGSPPAIDDADELLTLFERLGIRWLCTTAGSPYYNPHIQRPALFPPSDGYQPPEDPVVGVARQIDATARLKARHPSIAFVGSAYSYLQEWLPHVAQAAVRTGAVDVVGLGRLMLSYPHFPADVLAGGPLQTRLLCRTFSDCTTAPRNGLVSGCYPLDKTYVARPEAKQLKVIKAAMAAQAE
jgi:2,4-dienoyl-CoA reductase-like NADH-dependent reductase (Old Yellow Enzyme family)